jgi:hypothetical protein
MNTLAIVGDALFAFLAFIFIGDRFLVAAIARIAGVMERWRNGELSARSGMTPKNELHGVGAQVDRLLDKLAKRRLRNDRMRMSVFCSSENSLIG